jgi:hypothetical protein
MGKSTGWSDVRHIFSQIRMTLSGLETIPGENGNNASQTSVAVQKIATPVARSSEDLMGCTAHSAESSHTQIAALRSASPRDMWGVIPKSRKEAMNCGEEAVLVDRLFVFSVT